VLRGHWYHIIVLNVHASTDDKIDYVRDSFYEELGHMFDNFPKHHMNSLLQDFNAKVGKETIFKPTVGNYIVHEIVMMELEL
jgi:hypothetical protein